MKYSRSCLVQWHDENGSWLERVLEIDGRTGELACIKIAENSKVKDSGCRPFWRSIEVFEQALKDERARVIEKDPFLKPPVNPAALGESRRAEWEKICEAMKPIVNDPKQRILRGGKKSGGLVVAAAAAAGLTRRTIYRLLLKFWRGGQTMQCFLPDYGTNSGKTRQFKGGKKRGRYSSLEKKAGQKIGITIMPEKGERIVASLKRHYVGGNVFEQAYDLMIKELYCDPGELRDGYIVPVPRATEEIPNLRQALFLYEKARDPERDAKARWGKNFFNLKGRAITGNTETGLAGPGEVGQMDATTADIYLRSEYDPTLIVGRPVIYGIKDAWARFLYSMVVTFERPSYWGAAIALENALVDKVEYCGQLGITISPTDWPVDFLPGTLLVDRGEMSMYKSDHLVTGLGLEIDSAPPGRGDLKGIIEQQFRLNNTQAINWLPGALPRYRDDRNKRCEFDATLNISEFRRILLKSILCYHRNLLPIEYKLSADMIAGGVAPRPIELLHWGIENRPRLFRRFPLDQARFHLLPHTLAKVTEKGVRVNGVYFTCQRAVVEKWFERARLHKAWDCEVAFDPRIADRVYFQVAKGSAIECLDLVPADRRFKGWTWEEVEGHFSEQKSIRLEDTPRKLKGKMDLLAMSESIAKNAEDRQDKAVEASPKNSNAKQLGNIPQNRAAEKARDRANSHASNSRTATPLVREVPPGNVVQFPVSNPVPVPVKVATVSAFTSKLATKLNQHITKNEKP